MLSRAINKTRRLIGGTSKEIESLKAELIVKQNVIDELCNDIKNIHAYHAARSKEWTYKSDALQVYGKAVGFMEDPDFWNAYNFGMDSGHKIARKEGSKDDIGIHWRIHVALWIAAQCLRLPGDFVECGVNTGITSLAICKHFNFERLEKNFYLFDTFCGIPEEQASNAEKELSKWLNDEFYSECFEITKNNFQAYPNAHLVCGIIPESLTTVAIDAVSYLHIDLNLAFPERKTLEFFWGKLTPGAYVLLDDYGWACHSSQKQTADEFAKLVDRTILELPTGQGVLQK